MSLHCNTECFILNIFWKHKRFSSNISSKYIFFYFNVLFTAEMFKLLDCVIIKICGSEICWKQSLYIQRDIQTLACNHCDSEKAILRSVCVFVPLCIQRAVHMRRIILSSVACQAVQYFSTLSHKRYESPKKKKYCWA